MASEPVFSQELVLQAPTPIQHDPPSPMSILQSAVDKGADITTIERLVALQEHMLAREDEIAFNESMRAAQEEMGPVRRDCENPQTKSKYASYEALDRAIRPVYTKHGFSISYNSADSPKPEHVRVLAYCAKRGYTRTYQCDMPADGKGAKGGDVMTKTHASGAALAYGKRYLLKMIFNIAEGEGDTDGNIEMPKWVNEYAEAIQGSSDYEDIDRYFREGWKKTEGNKKFQDVLIKAKDRRRAELRSR